MNNRRLSLKIRPTHCLNSYKKWWETATEIRTFSPWQTILSMCISLGPVTHLDGLNLLEGGKMQTIPQQTKRESYEQSLATVGPRQKEVLDLLKQCPDGLSAWEMASILHRDVYTIRPRITELYQDGWIRPWGTQFCQKTQRNETIWVYVKNRGELF